MTWSASVADGGDCETSLLDPLAGIDCATWNRNGADDFFAKICVDLHPRRRNHASADVDGSDLCPPKPSGFYAFADRSYVYLHGRIFCPCAICDRLIGVDGYEDLFLNRLMKKLAGSVAVAFVL